MFCPQCKAEYRVGFTRCSDCGVALVNRLPAEPPRLVESPAELVVVRTYQNRFEADVAKTALDAAGIESMLRSDDYGGRGPNLTLTQGIEILVRAEDARDADAILSIDLTGANNGYLPE